MTEQTTEFETTKEEVTTPEGVEGTRPGRTYVPRADIYEKKDGILVLADLPGVNENSLDITLEKGVLTIDGQAAQSWPEGYTLSHFEYDVGNFFDPAYTMVCKLAKSMLSTTIR